MIWDVLDQRTMSEDAEALLRPIWAGKGMPVQTERILDRMYEDDPDGGPSEVTMYAAFHVALEELDAVLVGVGVVRVGRREGYLAEVDRIKRESGFKGAAPLNG